MTLRPPAHVAGLVPYVPGKPIEEVERELGISDSVKLASNENPVGPSPLALAAAREALADVHRYPDDGGWALRQRLAAHFGLAADGIVVGAGSSELIRLAVGAYVGPGDEAVMAAPAFVVYKLAVTAAAGRPVEVPCRGLVHDLDAMLAAVTPRTRIVFVCNPNNPTGTVVTEPAFGRFVDRLPPDLLLVVDEAYIEFVDRSDVPDGLAYLRDGRPGRPPVLVLRTFSKIYGLAGLRVGYGLTTPAVAADLNRVRPPFNVSRPALAAAEAALADRSHLETTRDVTLEGRRYLAEAIGRLGLEVVPSQANFLLVKTPVKGAALADALLGAGVIVRPVDGYGLPDHVRISVGTRIENERCVAALAACLRG
ncbi:MAG TPA: histidinol-phosphate transaminase [Thermodesulfobacteriota bacterium]